MSAPILLHGGWDPPRRPSGWRLLLMVLVAYSTAQVLSGIMLFLLIGLPTSLAELHARIGEVQLARNVALPSVVGEAAMFVIAWLFMHRQLALREIGAGPLRWRDFGVAVTVVVAVLVASVLFGALLHAQDVPSQLKLAQHLHGLWETPAIAISAGVAEEVTFRGYLLTGLSRMWPRTRWLAVLLSSLGFALAHLAWGLQPVQFAFYVALGVILALSVQWQRSLWPAVIAHAAWDVLALALLMTTGVIA